MQSSWCLKLLKKAILPSGENLRTIPLGFFRGLRCPIDFSYQTQLYFGLWERETYPFLRRGALDCAWAVDIGAGSGELVVALLIKSKARTVIACEPLPAERAKLNQLIAQNCASQETRLTLVTKYIGSTKDGAHEPLDDIVKGQIGRGFIKVDVDGAELDVLASASAILARGNVDLLIETHSNNLEKACIELLRRTGFRYEIVPNAWWRVIVPEQRPIDHNRWLWATKA